MSNQKLDLSEDVQLELLSKLQEKGLQEFFREMMEFICNEVMKMERTQFLNAKPYERCEDRNGSRNGFKDRTLHTSVGSLELRIPKDRDGNFHPSLFAKYQRSEKALVLALQEMYINGVSTRKTKKITEKLCGTEFSKDQVSRFAKQLDKKVEAWRTRTLQMDYPYLVIDARYEKIRENGSTQSCGVLIVKGVREDNKREIIGVEVANTENETTWSNLFRDLKDRGLSGVSYIVSDRHEGLKSAIDRHFQGVIWQRCQEHWVRNGEDRVKKSEEGELRERLEDALHAPTLQEARYRMKQVIQEYEQSHPDLADWIGETYHEVLQVFHLPKKHRRRMRTNNSLERFNQEIKRRTKVVRVFPNRQSCRRLVTAICMEQSEDWVTGYDYLDMSLIEKDKEDENDEIEEKKFVRKEKAEACSMTFTEKT